MARGTADYHLKYQIVLQLIYLVKHHFCVGRLNMGILKQIVFNNQQAIELGSGDIVVFVGPNNVGKSQALHDIFALCKHPEQKSVIVKSLDLSLPSPESMMEIVRRNCAITKEGPFDRYRGYDYHGSSSDVDYLIHEPAIGNMRNLVVSLQSTEKRLQIANPPEIINRDEPKSHPIHYVAMDSEYRKRLSNYFEKAFGKKLTPNTQYGRQIPLCIGDEVKLGGNYSDEQERQEEYARILGKYPMVHEQGDGIRSFVGIILNLMLDRYRLHLIDEPESFLHPPQARIIGELIGELSSSDKQVLVSTHSKEVIQGLVETCSDRVKIIRITRSDNTNTFSILNNEAIANLWNDPLLQYSDIMDCMFHKSSVLCEGDADCLFYSFVYSQLSKENGFFPEVRFVHCGGKHRMKNIVNIFENLGIDYRVVADFDVLNDMNTFRTLFEACGGNWSDIERDYRIVRSNIDSQMKQIKRSEISAILSNSKAVHLNEDELRDISDAIKRKSPWANVKEHGEDALPRGDAREAYNRMKNKILQGKLRIVPNGQLESFVPDCGGHGPSWLNNVFEKHPNPEDPVYEAARSFVESWGI